MTAEERAKNCLPGCYDPQGRQCSANETCEIHYRVAQEIKAACEEAVKLHEHCKRCAEAHMKPPYQCPNCVGIGFADARQRAAKIAETPISYEVWCANDGGHGCAEAIRALTPDGQEKLS